MPMRLSIYVVDERVGTTIPGHHQMVCLEYSMSAAHALGRIRTRTVEGLTLELTCLPLPATTADERWNRTGDRVALLHQNSRLAVDVFVDADWPPAREVARR